MKNLLLILVLFAMFNDLSAQKWTTYTTANGLANNRVLAIAIDEQGNKWFGTDGGLSKFDDSTWATYNSTNGLKTDYICTIAIDKNDKKRFNNCNGFMSYDNTNFSYTKIQGNADNCFFSCPVYTVTVDANNIFWIGMSPNIDGYNIIGKDGYSSFNAQATVISIASDKNRNVWFGTESNGTMVYYGGDKTKKEYFNLFINTPIVSNRINAIVIDAQNNKWFGTDKGVSKFDSINWSTFNIGYIYAIAVDLNGNLWFGKKSGVSMYDGTNWISYTTADGLVSNNIYSIAIDSQNNKWFGTDAGVSKFESGNSTSVISNNSNSNDFLKISPNPVSDVLFVTLANQVSKGTIEIYSLNGTQIFKSEISNSSIDIDISKLTSGFYFVKYIMSNGKIVLKKIIKQ